MKITILTVALFSVFSIQACEAEGNKTKKNTSCEKSCKHDEANSLDITLKSGKVIEIAFATIEGGKEAELSENYFPKILPLAAKYGGKMLGSFQVLAITGGEIQPQMVAIFEWPSVDAQKQLLADKKAQKLFSIRDAALTSIQLAYYEVEEDVTVSFQKDKTYEFFNAWLTPESKTALPEYFKQSEAPKLKYGPPKFVASLKPLINVPNESFILQPQMAGIVEWNNVATYYGLVADPDFKKASPLLEKSVRRLDMIQTRINMP